MDSPHEFITLQTLAKEEPREDPETGEMYMEQIIIAEDKKLRRMIDLFDISSYEELTNNNGSIYAKRCVIYVQGEQLLVASSYNDITELLSSINGNNKKVGFGRDKKKKKSSKA